MTINKETTLNESGTAPFLTFNAFIGFEFIRHGFSTRLGGLSDGCFSSMNLGLNRGDDDEIVMENYRRICSSMGIVYSDLVFTDQVHKTNIRRATAADKGKGILLKRDYAEIDGHMTDEPGVPLMVFGADCVPLYLVDPVHHAIGLAHSGWKGTAARMGQKMVERMGREFGTRAEDIVTVIGPSICGECYEVGAEVREAFAGSFSDKNLSEIFKTSESGAGKFMLDLWRANEILFYEAGVPEEHVHSSGLCTMCRDDLMFSHRRDGMKRGSMAGFLCLI